MKIYILACLIQAMVDTSGSTINVNHLRYLTKDASTGGCLVYQYYNPYVIKSDWTCKEVERSIIHAIRLGCNNV